MSGPGIIEKLLNLTKLEERKIKAVSGKRISRVACIPFDGAREGSRRVRCHEWRIYLDDGTSLTFSAEETEIGEYGVDMNVIVKGKMLK